jgi:hypothetical protein
MSLVNKQSKRFYEILEQIKELHDKKRHDYGANEDIFANFRLSELSGIPAWQGSVVRMGDKYARMSNFIKKGEFKFKEENIKDTLMDMAIYSLITMILFEEAEMKKEAVEEKEVGKLYHTHHPSDEWESFVKYDKSDNE